MPTLRAHRATLFSPSGPSLRVHAAAATGTAPTTARLRAFGVSMAGALRVTIAPIQTQTVGPGSVATVTAVPSSSPDSFSWRQISGPSVTLSGTGAVRTFVAPSAMPPGATVVLGVTPVVNGIAGTEVTARVDVPPQTRWVRVHGGQWVGSAVAAG